MTPEEELLERYFDAFNRHDIEGVMACFHRAPAILDVEGRRFEGCDEVKRRYENSFASMPDCRCTLRTLIGHSGQGAAESLFQRTRPRYGTVVLEIGAEVMGIVDGRIKEIRDYHQPVNARAGESDNQVQAAR